MRLQKFEHWKMTHQSSTPRLFDLQVNGFAGIDFQNPALRKSELEFACMQLRAHGVSGFLFTIITAPIGQLCHQMEQVMRWRQESSLIRDMVEGIHLEGPFISDVDGFRGAHPRHAVCDPTPDFLKRLTSLAGELLRLVTLAPERKGAIEAIREFREAGVTVALGHTDANEREIDLAIGAGASLCTHLGNGVPQMLHRHENVINRLLARDELTACFIPDGVHVPFTVLKNYVRAKGWARTLFTTDCMAAAAAPSGVYGLGELELIVGSDRIVRQPNGTGFAGSSLTPDKAVMNVQEQFGISQAEAEMSLGERVREILQLPLKKAEVI